MKANTAIQNNHKEAENKQAIEETKEVGPTRLPGSISPNDIELMQEFEEDTETIFKQSETCYTHYKAMLR